MPVRTAPRHRHARRWAVGATAAMLAGGVTLAANTPARPSSAGETTESATTGLVAQQRRPNIVMIMVDDMRTDELRYMPRTRRLIGRRGVTFANSFAPYPLCCPARASVLVGQYTHNHRVFGTNEPWGFHSFDDSSTLATWLRRSGYATIYLGKYLNGYGPMPAPGKETGKSVHYVPPGWTDWRASIDGGLPRGHPKRGRTYAYFNTTLSHDGVGFDNYRGKYQSRVYGTLSQRIIRSRAASARPFFFYASYTAPHFGTPREPDDPRWVTRDDGVRTRLDTPARPREVRGMFDNVIKAAPGADWHDPDFSDKPSYLQGRPPTNAAERGSMRELARQRAESLHVVDVQVERTIRALAASGELRRTLVMFTSDNGYFLGEQRIRSGKTFPHEPSLRVPTLIRGPGVPAGQVRRDPFTSIDFAPTIAAMAGVVPRVPVDGVSMLRVARRGDQGWSRAVLTETGPVSKRVTRDTDEAGRPLDPNNPGARDVRFAIGIRTARYLYVDLASGEEELYDLAFDPEEYDNLVGNPAYADTLALLREELRRMRACDGPACSAPMAPDLVTPP